MPNRIQATSAQDRPRPKVGQILGALGGGLRSRSSSNFLPGTTINFLPGTTIPTLDGGQGNVGVREQQLEALGRPGSTIRRTVKGSGLPVGTDFTDELHATSNQGAGLRNAALIKSFAESDPRVQELRARGDAAVAGIDPAQLDALSKRIQGFSDLAGAQQQQARDLALASRSQASPALQQLQRFSLGQDSAVARNTALESDRLASQIASQAASGRGGATPAAQRAAAFALSQGQAELGARGAVAQADERRQATAALLNALSAQRQQDMVQQGGDISAGTGQAAITSQAAQIARAADAQRLGLFGLGRQAELDEQRLFGSALAPFTGFTPGGLSGTGEAIGGLGGSAVALLGSAFGGGDD